MITRDRQVYFAFHLEPVFVHKTMIPILITHSQREAYMDLVENRGGGRRQEVEEPQGM